MRILKQSTITSVVTQTGLSYEDVLKFFYEDQTDAATAALMNMPRDTSLIGFDDIEMASYTRPSLTAVRQPILRMGHKAVAQGHILAKPKIRFTTELIIRDSTSLAPR